MLETKTAMKPFTMFAYTLFWTENFEKVQEDNPLFYSCQVMKQLDKMWYEDENIRQIYEEKAYGHSKQL